MNKKLLTNGLRIVHLPVSDSEVDYYGFAVKTGSRNESLKEHGLAHFVEHTLFKGTERRSAWHILNRMENVGGELNAYTTKENTFVYSVFMEKDFERAAELLTDLVSNSVFPANEIEKERDVIADEIAMYEDTPNELIFDDFENILFEGHPLGHNILGDRRSLRSFNTVNARGFLEQNYTADNMVFFVMSKTDYRKVCRIAEKYMGCIPVGREKKLNTVPNIVKVGSVGGVSSKTIIKKKRTHLSHVVLGGIACSMFDTRRYALSLLNNILGGPGMNSRLNVSLREKRGLVYSVESNYTAYGDTGAFTVYLGTEANNRSRSLELVDKELNTLRTNQLSELALHAAKKQAIGQICVANDNRESRFLSLGKAFLNTNNYESLPEIISHIEQISASQLLEAANEFLNPDNISALIYE